MRSGQVVLVVDDQESMRRNVKDVLTREHLQVVESSSGEDALHRFRALNPQLVLLDINLPGMDGISVLREMKRLEPDIPVIIFTAYGTSERAIEAMKGGAHDYLEKPFELDEFLIIIRRGLSFRDLLSEVRHLRSQVARQSAPTTAESIVGTNAKMQEIFKLIGRVAPTDATVLIEGESGTGKELVADAIQRHSLRPDGPFIKVNCAALPEHLLESELFGHEKGSFTGAISQRHGRFELAHGGTIFLDEINNMPVSLQMKLLRVLQQRTFERVGGKETLTTDVRIIAATNKDIEQEVKAGRFREDLFYRLDVIHLKLPTLRDRAQDIPLLVDHFLEKYGQGTKAIVAADAMTKLRTYRWPGNVRELENTIQRAVLLSGGNLITLDHLPVTLQAAIDPPPLPEANQDDMDFHRIVTSVEKQLITKALQRTQWNRTKAAELLRIHRRLLFSKIKQYKLKA